MRVLYVNQTGRISGAERSLLDLIDGLPPRVSAAVACPPGELSAEVRARGVPVYPIRETDMSFRLHPRHTAAGLLWILRSSVTVRRLAGNMNATVVHANTTRAGLASALAALGARRSLVVHVRDLIPAGRPGRIILGVIERAADAVVANSRHVAAQFPTRSGGLPVRVIHNGLNLDRFHPELPQHQRLRTSIGMRAGDTAIAVVGQFAPLKGQDDAVRVLALLASRYPHLRLLFAGTAKFNAPATRFDHAEFERDVHRLARTLGVESRVSFLGERRDVADILAAVDVLLVPSWGEGFGRTVLEGMAMRRPVIATCVGGPSEIIRDGVDGLLLAPRDPERWARSVGALLDDPLRAAVMGESARRRVESEFSLGKHVDRVLALYAELSELARVGR